MLAALLLAPLIGLLLALFGAGGGMLTVPLLTYGLHLPIKSAIAASLWIVASVSLVTLLRERAWKVLNFKLLMVFMLGGLLGSWSGAKLGLALPSIVQTSLFGALVLFVAWWMQRPVTALEGQGDTECHCMKAFMVAVLLGVATGVLGVGGGFLIVPALIWLGISKFRVAVAHSLVVITLNASVAGFAYLGHVEFAFALLLWIAVLAAAGSVIGSGFAGRLKAADLRVWFSRLLMMVGILMIGESIRDVLLH